MTVDRALPFGLAGLAALIGLALIVEFLVPWSPSQGEGETASLPAVTGPTTGVAPAAVTDLVDRPLFTATRRPLPAVAAAPPVEPAKPVEPPPQPAATLTLLGIVGGSSGRIAVIRLQTTPQPVRVTEGGKVDRWEVRQILADHVLLVAAGTVQELGFPTGAGHAGTARAPAVKH